jgi:hypothetical protein
MFWIDGVNVINKAIEKSNEQKDWDLYKAIYPNMDKSNYLTFKQFVGKKQVMKTEKEVSNEDILAKAEELKKLHQGTHEGVRKED